MIKLHKLIATVGGIGYIGKGGGTVAAIFICLIYLVIPAGKFLTEWQVFFIIAVTAVGIWSGNVVDSLWGKDSSKVVIDEAAGMMISLFAIPISIKYVVAALILFRFFDIAKPLFIRRTEKFPKGIGVMADDVLAGIYAQIIMQIIIAYQLF